MTKSRCGMSAVDTLLRAAGLAAQEAVNDLRIRVLMIGPAEAKALLVANTDNRPLRPGRVKFYARTMQAGGWKLTHQGLAFGANGQGLDLQHRLTAIMMSGVTVPMVVTEGLSQEAFAAIDQHERRSLADALKLGRDLTEEARMLLSMMSGDDAAHPTLEKLAEVADDIKAEHSMLLSACATRRAIFSAVPVRVGAITLMLEQPYSASLICQAYRDLVLSKTEKWSPAMHAFGRQVAGGKANSTGTGRVDLFARALAALDPARRSLSKIQIVSTEVAKQRARSALGVKGGAAP